MEPTAQPMKRCGCGTPSEKCEELARTIQPAKVDPDAALVFDVRREADYAASDEIIPGAMWKNPDKIHAWIGALPKDASRDGIVQRYVDAITWQYPEQAVQFVAMIGDDKLRARATQNIAQNWINSNPESAGVWIAGSDLPDDQKRRLLEQVKKRSNP